MEVEIGDYNNLYGYEKTLVKGKRKKRIIHALNKPIVYDGLLITKKKMALEVHQKFEEIISINKNNVTFHEDYPYPCKVTICFDLKCQVDLLLFLRGKYQ